ncbi:hypothetical protein [Spirobacillus cienkowskii]|uniref:hypothetical protein n=1 Tax=Spirobacillus cienkowskii TaxID=495820 RepID=UPI0030CC9E24
MSDSSVKRPGLKSVVSHKAILEGDFLIEETRFSCNENGLKTSLKLVLKDAYTQKTERDKQSVGEIGEV